MFYKDHFKLTIFKAIFNMCYITLFNKLDYILHRFYVKDTHYIRSDTHYIHVCYIGKLIWLNKTKFLFVYQQISRQISRCNEKCNSSLIYFSCIKRFAYLYPNKNFI